MHRFFLPYDFPFEIPNRVYARLIDRGDGDYVLFDAVHAQDFDYAAAEKGFSERSPSRWRGSVEFARIYAIEINSLADNEEGATWLKAHATEGLPEWSVITLVADTKGAAEVYNNIAGTPQRARLEVAAASRELQEALARATDLTPDLKKEPEIVGALPKSPIQQVFVLDVGQGSANAVVDVASNVVAYVDLGAGVLRDAKTWPGSMAGICLRFPPVVILTHWHYDHFQAANIFPAAQRMTWIAPLQTLGPGPQSAMASAISSTGILMVWNGTGTLSAGSMMLERCKGPVGNQNRTGIAVWIDGPAGTDPILLPGDAGYADIPKLVGGQTISGFVVSHHGGRAHGSPPARPVGTPRTALSYGHKNRYKHPLAASLAGLGRAGWAIGTAAAGADERRTEKRPGGIGGTGLGHIRVDWLGGASPSHRCTCGCSLDPTQ